MRIAMYIINVRTTFESKRSAAEENVKNIVKKIIYFCVGFIVYITIGITMEKVFKINAPYIYAMIYFYIGMFYTLIIMKGR